MVGGALRVFGICRQLCCGTHEVKGYGQYLMVMVGICGLNITCAAHYRAGFLAEISPLTCYKPFVQYTSIESASFVFFSLKATNTLQIQQKFQYLIWFLRVLFILSDFLAIGSTKCFVLCPCSCRTKRFNFPVLMLYRTSCSNKTIHYCRWQANPFKQNITQPTEPFRTHLLSFRPHIYTHKKIFPMPMTISHLHMVQSYSVELCPEVLNTGSTVILSTFKSTHSAADNTPEAIVVIRINRIKFSERT